MSVLRKELDGKLEEISHLRTEMSKLKGEMNRLNMEVEDLKKKTASGQETLIQRESAIAVLRDEKDKTKMDAEEAVSRLQQVFFNSFLFFYSATGS